MITMFLFRLSLFLVNSFAFLSQLLEYNKLSFIKIYIYIFFLKNPWKGFKFHSTTFWYFSCSRTFGSDILFVCFYLSVFFLSKVTTIIRLIVGPVVKDQSEPKMMDQNYNFIDISSIAFPDKMAIPCLGLTSKVSQILVLFDVIFIPQRP